MSYQIEKKEGNAVIDVTLAWTDLEGDFNTAVEGATKNVSKNANMKGFRKGHVPESVAKDQVDRLEVLSQTVDTKLRALLTEAMEKESLKVAGTPSVNVKKLAEGNDVEVEVTMALIPSCDLPKDWQKTITDINKDFDKQEKDVTVEDEELQKEITSLAESRTKSEEVDRAVVDGDQVTLDFEVKQDGVVIEGGTSTDHNLIIGSGAFIPGFEEQIIGLEKGAEKTFTLAFPDKYHADHLAGKDAEFSVVIKKVEERKTPKMDDAFAKEVSAGSAKEFTSLDELKADMKTGMEESKKQQLTEARRTAYLEKLSDQTEVDVSDVLIADETGRMLSEMQQQVSGSGMDFADYLARTGGSEEELKEQWKPQAKKRIVSAMLLEKLGDEYKIDPDSKEVEEEMNKVFGAYQGMEGMQDQINMQEMYQYTKGIMRNNQVFEKLADLS